MAAALGGGLGRRAAARLRAGADHEAGGVPRRDRRGGRAPRARTGSPAYALELAQEFTAFYRDCRVVGRHAGAVEAFRIALSVAAQRTIALSLGLLGVSAPESM